jgi:hypothetical protein
MAAKLPRGLTEMRMHLRSSLKTRLSDRARDAPP